ncbi:hypothetical protein AAG570_013147 [Ranatra chinensis]|uniref:Uncharacterized protein n=1 Tax=Ranatra chinensis TaxID=642074 RepID=A0ABD0YGF9_9HEMI
MSHQEKYLLNSIEEGMHTVKKNQNSAVIGGRETFFYNIRRLGAHNFYLSDKLYTRYSAIAFQTGCPFVESFNKIIVALFEAGILSKISEEEYYILGQNLKNTDQEKLAAPPVVNTNNSTLQPINMKTLQGAFFILLIGLAIAGNTLTTNNYSHCRTNKYSRMRLLAILDELLYFITTGLAGKQY